MRALLTSIFICAALSAPVLAEDYRLEVRGSYEHLEPDEGYLDDGFDTLRLSATWYLAPVSTKDVPLAEAAFLGRASYVSALASRLDGFLGEELDALGASVGYYIPKTRFFAGAAVSRAEDIIAISSTTVLKDHRTRWSGVVGVTPLDGLLVTTAFNEDSYEPNIRAKHVGKLPNGHFYSGGVGLVKPDRGDLMFGVDFDYYFDDTASLGVGYTDGSETITVRGRKFFSESWAIGVSAQTDDLADRFQVEVTWRH